jgi:hypothetical protein
MKKKNFWYKKNVLITGITGFVGSNLAKNLKINVEQDLSDITTMIVPLTISYYPIRPGTNKIKGLINRLAKKIPSNIAEELEVETNLGLKEVFTEEKLFPEPVRLLHEVTSFPEV